MTTEIDWQHCTLCPLTATSLYAAIIYISLLLSIKCSYFLPSLAVKSHVEWNIILSPHLRLY